MRRCGFLAKRTRLIPGLAAFIALPVVPAAAQGPVPPAGQSPAQSQTPQFGTAGSNALQTRRRPPVPENRTFRALGNQTRFGRTSTLSRPVSRFPFNPGLKSYTRNAGLALARTTPRHAACRRAYPE
jgi:hypothetical protein